MKLYHFTRDEFDRNGENWLSLCCPRLLVLLDVFRYQWGQPVVISPHHHALGRRDWPNPNSDHAVDVHGEVLAVDVLPAGMDTRADAEVALDLARNLAFTSLGLYPDWKPSPGLHLGVRRSARPGFPASWGALRRTPDGVYDASASQTYVSLEAALNHMEP